MPTKDRIEKAKAKNAATEFNHVLGPFTRYEDTSGLVEAHQARCVECGAIAVVYTADGGVTWNLDGPALEDWCGQPFRDEEPAPLLAADVSLAIDTATEAAGSAEAALFIKSAAIKPPPRAPNPKATARNRRRREKRRLAKTIHARNVARSAARWRP